MVAFFAFLTLHDILNRLIDFYIPASQVVSSLFYSLGWGLLFVFISGAIVTNLAISCISSYFRRSVLNILFTVSLVGCFMGFLYSMLKTKLLLQSGRRLLSKKIRQKCYENFRATIWKMLLVSACFALLLRCVYSIFKYIIKSELEESTRPT